MAEKIVLSAFKKLMIRHMQNHVEISSWTILWAGVALIGNTELGSVIHSGRDLQLERLFLFDPSISTAYRAGILDDLARTATMVARLGNREKSLLETNLTITIAGRTRCRTEALLGSASAAFRTRVITGNLDFSGGTKRRFLESDFEVVTQVRSSLNPAAAAT